MHPPARRGVPVLAAGLLALLVLLAAAVVAGLAVGAKSMPASTVLDALLHYNPDNADHVLVLTLRLPRTVIGLLAGAALGLAGTMMQGLARNPLADPGILGVNSGAALGVVIAISVFGI